ncbi:MAG TPA: sterol desaturase family protein [Stellaceae bacterium]|nr:sterol desaturase family protein [Stellaceae bacterium]
MPEPTSGALLRFLALFGGFFLVAAWELAWPRRQQAVDVGGRWVGNIVLYLVNSALMVWLLPEPARIRGEIAAALGVALPGWPFAGALPTIVAGVLVCDVLRYGLHRLEHAVPFLWRLHALHHSDPDLDVSTALRHHPLEIVAGSALLWIGFLVIDIPPLALFAYGVVLTTTAAIQHGNLRLPPRWEPWLQRLLVTSDMHRIHHALARSDADSNYGAVFSLWDRVFGTFRRLSPEAHEALCFGIAELRAAEYQTLPAMLMSPWLLARAGNGRRAQAPHGLRRVVS